jgi:hypothetical protein
MIKWGWREAYKTLGVTDIPTSFRPGRGFLGTSGHDWEFQENKEWKKKILCGLASYYESYLSKNMDKGRRTVFLSFAGAGTGKSRLLQEFHGLVKRYLTSLVEYMNQSATASGVATAASTVAVPNGRVTSSSRASSSAPTTPVIEEKKMTAIYEDEKEASTCTTLSIDDYRKLLQRVTDACVFHVNFGNGTLYTMSEQMTPDQMVGTRMAYQLYGNSEWSAFYAKKKYTIDEALELLHRITKKIRKDQTVIILVDELTNLLGYEPYTGAATSQPTSTNNNKDESKGVPFDVKKTLLITEVMRSVTAHVNQSGELVITAMAGTVTSLSETYVEVSRQKREKLIPPILDPSSIINTSDSTIRALIEDMGGHGRALEQLLFVVCGIVCPFLL